MFIITPCFCFVCGCFFFLLFFYFIVVIYFFPPCVCKVKLRAGNVLAAHIGWCAWGPGWFAHSQQQLFAYFSLIYLQLGWLQSHTIASICFFRKSLEANVWADFYWGMLTGYRSASKQCAGHMATCHFCCC